MHSQHIVSRWLLVVSSVLVMAGCGGGGGSSAPAISSSSVSSSRASQQSSVVISSSSAITQLSSDGASSISSAQASSSSASSVQDTEPNSFAFTPVNGVVSGTEVNSSTETITGITGAVPISVEGGTYTIVGKGTATSNPGTIENGEQVFVTGQASDRFNTSTTVSLTIGETTENFVITSWEENTRPQTFSFADKTEAKLDMIYTSGSVTINGINSTASVSVSEGAEYCIGDCSEPSASFTADEGEVSNGESIVLRAKSAAVYSEDKSYTLTVGGVSATWTISTLGDSVNPTASIIFPTKVSLTDGTTLTVRGTAEDVSGIQKVTVSVFNDDTLFGTAVDAVAVEDSLTHWTATVTLNGETDGTINTQTVNTVRVSVTDGVGNENVNAAEVSVTHQADYAKVHFPAEYETELPELRGPTALSLDVSKNRLLYVYSEEVRAIDLNSSIRKFVASTSGANYIAAEAVGDVIVLTDAYSKVLSYDEGSQQFSTITDATTQLDAPFDAPTDFKFNPVDNLYYVLDALEDTLISVNEDGFRTLISGPTFPAEEDVVIDGPRSLAIDVSDAFGYITSGMNTQLLRIDLAAGDREVIEGTTFDQPQDLAIDNEAGLLYISDYKLNKIFAIDLRSNAVTEFVSGSSGDNRFPGLKSMAIDADKSVLYFVAGELFYPSSTILQLDLKTKARVVVNKSPISD